MLYIRILGYSSTKMADGHKNAARKYLFASKKFGEGPPTLHG